MFSHLVLPLYNLASVEPFQKEFGQRIQLGGKERIQMEACCCVKKEYKDFIGSLRLIYFVFGDLCGEYMPK